MNLKPTRGLALIEPLEAEAVTGDGVYLPDRIQEKQARGKVLAVGDPTYEALEIAGGPRAYHDCDELNGKTVVFKKYVDNKVKEGDQEYLLVPFSDILAIYGDN